jgi:hypothetical protein
VILLPLTWHSWSNDERRAVLAHELAHVVRGDYAAGLLARLALALNAFHPLVRWMAARLHMQQELAADALGARYAGGKARYLVALARLALEQDRPSPCWPARAFLPRRGTLIRRIQMLREHERTGTDGRAWRLVPATVLLGLTIAVGLLRGPARSAADEPPSAPHAGERPPAGGTAFPNRSYADVVLGVARGIPQGRVEQKPSAPLYLRDGKDGVLVFRPAATFRHAGMSRFADLLDEGMRQELAELKIDPAQPGFLRLSVRDIEWVTASVGFGKTTNDKREKRHVLRLGNPVVRTVAPFDWLALLRLCHCKVEEVRIEAGTYYRIRGPIADQLGPNACVYLPDDRTIIVDDETNIRELVGMPPTTPDYLRGVDWRGASQGLFAVALKNGNGLFAKHYETGRPDDALVLPLFKYVDHWVFSVADTDALALWASAVCRDRGASDAVARAVGSLCALGRETLANTDRHAAGESEQRASRLVEALLAHLSIIQVDKLNAPDGPPLNNLMALQADRMGTLADLATILKAELFEVDNK